VNTRFALEMALAPLSLQGVGIWIRSVLQWEAPAAFRTWLHDQTMGLPGLLRSSLPKLDAQGILSATTAGWSLRPDYAATTLVSSSALLDGPRAYNLPASLNHFVGRERDIQYLKQQIGAGPLVTIVGAGGIGKTRLALQVAMEMLEQFRHGVWFVPLADVGSVEQMVFTIAIVLDLPLVAQRSAKDQLIAGLHNRDLLLVVDNMEHLLDGGGLLTEIIAQAPNVKLLVTSRERLGLPHETSIELKGLPFPAAGTEASLEHASAMRLFVHSARQRGQNFTVSDDDLPSIWQICRLVEGMPLGIELAAAWTALFTCREIADQLAHDYDFLAAAPGTAYPQNSLRTVFDYFWRQLSEDEQRVVRRLGVFRGGFDREAAHVIAGASPFLLAALVDKAFLTRTSTGRYSLHKLLQQYAETHLAAVPGDHAAVRQGHAAYYLMLAERAEHELLGDAQTTWLDRLEAEHENLRTVLAWSRDPATNELGLRLAGLLGQFWRVRGHCSEGRTWLREVLREEQTQSQYYWKALRWSGVLAQEQGDYSVAWEILEQCLASARRRDDRHGIADSQGYLGWIASVQGRYDQAHTLLTEGLAVARKLDDTVTILHILNNLGEVTYRQGRFADSRACYAESLILAQTLGDRREIGESLLGLGNAAMSQDRYAEAEATYNECLMHARTIDDRRRIGESLGNLGIVAQKRGAYAQAQQYFRDCLAVFEAIGNQLDIAMALVVLGTVALDLEDEQSARHYLRASLARAMAIGALPVALEALAGIAELHIRAGMPEQAAAWLGLIQAHPSISTEVRNNVTARLDALRAQLQEESYSLLRAQAQEHTLETVVAEVLGSMGMLSI
jgi:predicted ATPase